MNLETFFIGNSEQAKICAGDILNCRLVGKVYISAVAIDNPHKSGVIAIIPLGDVSIKIRWFDVPVSCYDIIKNHPDIIECKNLSREPPDIYLSPGALIHDKTNDDLFIVCTEKSKGIIKILNVHTGETHAWTFSLNQKLNKSVLCEMLPRPLDKYELIYYDKSDLK